MFRLRNLKNLLASKGFQVKDLLNEILDLADATVYQYARGEGNPTLAALNTLAKGLENLFEHPIDINDLVEAVNLDNNNAEIKGILKSQDSINDEIFKNTESDNYQIVNVIVNKIRQSIAKYEPEVPSLELVQTQKTPPNSKKRIILPILASGILMVAGIFLGVALQNYYGFLEAKTPPVPKLLFPGREVVTEDIELVVEKTRNAKGYDFYLKNADNNLVLIETDDFENHRSTKLRVPPFLCRGGNYSWTARARNGGNASSWASAMPFKYNPPVGATSIPNIADFSALPEKPIPLSPQGTIDSIDLVLKLEANSDAVLYGFYMRDLTTDDLVVYAPYETKPEYKVDPSLIIDKHSYRWNANSINCIGFSKISDLAFFDVELP